MKCVRCGVVNLEEFNFCHNCGKQVQVEGLTQNEPEKSNEKNVQKKVQTFDQFRKRLSSQRQEQINTNKKFKAKKNKAVTSTEVMINIGLMKLVNGVFKPVKGKAMMVRVLSDIRKVPLLSKALEKHSAHDRSFDPNEDYTLAYPDGTEVLTLPGQPTQIFQLDKYKEDVGKSFNRITLYLIQRDLLNNDGGNESDDCEFSSESVHSVAAEEPCTSVTSATNNTSKDILLQSVCNLRNSEPSNSQPLSSPQNGRLSTSSSGSQTHSRHSTSSSYASGSFSCEADCTQASTSGELLDVLSTPKSSDEIVCDLDEIYATLLFDEINSEVFDYDPMEDIAETNVDDVTHDDIEENTTLKEILLNLAEATSYDQISIFNLSRNHIWEGTKRAMNRKLFSPRNKLSVKFTDDIGQSEGAVDMGGPAREFFTLITEWLVNSRLFFGGISSKFLSLNATCLEEREYFMAGQIFAMALVHGGPGVNCLSSSCYDAIVNESGTLNVSATLDDIHDFELRESLGKLLQAPCVDAARKIISDEKLDTVFDLAGTLQMIRIKADVDKIVQRTINWYVLGRSQPAYCSFKEGLRALGVLEAMLKYPNLFRKTFCYNLERLTVSMIMSVFKVKRAEEGSNRRNVESLVLSHWNDFLQDAEEDPTQINLSEILFFASGCKIFPPQGLHCELQFLHETEKDGKLSMFPKANTCACILNLPVVHGDYESFKNAAVFGIKNARGFGGA